MVVEASTFTPVKSPAWTSTATSEAHLLEAVVKVLQSSAEKRRLLLCVHAAAILPRCSW